MKKILALLLSCTMLLYGCAINQTASTSSESTMIITTEATEPSSETTEPTTEVIATPEISVDTHSEEYIQSLGFNSLSDPNLLQFMNDRIYSELETELDGEKYEIENISSIYISKEYIDELEYNSKKNVYFGYDLETLDAQFQGEKYIFTLGDDGQTTVKAFEEYDDTYEKALKRVAIGTGVILICVTVSVITGGVGAPAVSAVFAASAKTATTMALSTGVMSGVSSGIIKGIETQNFDEALKAAAEKGSSGFMWGAISGAVIGGASELYTIHNPCDIPNWRESEKWVLEEYGGKEQVAFFNGEEVAVNFQNSTRPDVVRQVGDGFEAIEVKNYDLESNFNNLCNVLSKQVGSRKANLPSNYTQRIVLDARNRGYSQEYLLMRKAQLIEKIPELSSDIPIDIITNVGRKVVTIAA